MRSGAMNPFLLPPPERLADWKGFRRALGRLPEPVQLDEVAGYFGQCPLQSIAYDVDAPAHWPSIWEMIAAGEWCRDSAAIGMHATLRLTGWAADRIELSYLRDPAAARMVLAIIVDRSKLLNYDWGVVTPLPDSVRMIRRYRWTGRGYADFGSQF